MKYQPENRDRSNERPLGRRLPSEPVEEYPLFQDEPEDVLYGDFARWIDKELLKLEARWSHLSVPHDPVNRLKLRELRLKLRKS